MSSTKGKKIMDATTCPELPVLLLKAAPALVLLQHEPKTPATAQAAESPEEVIHAWSRVSLRGVLKRFSLAWVAVFIVFAAMPLQAHADSLISNSSQRYRVLGQPTVSASFINRVLFTYHSPAAGKGQVLYNDGVRYGIDPVYALAFFLHESRFGTTGVARITRSLGNIRCTPGYPSCYRGFRVYAPWEDGFAAWHRLIYYFYVQRWGLTTVDQIIPVYAPASENDVQVYIAVVKYAVDTWRGGQVLV